MEAVSPGIGRTDNEHHHVQDDLAVPGVGQLPLDAQIRAQTDSGKPTVVSDPDGQVATIYKTIARRCAVKIAESQKDMTSKFPSIVVQNT